MRPSVAAVVRLRARWPLPTGPAAVVLGWHRVDVEGGKLAVPPPMFERQMALVASQRAQFPVVTVEEASAALARGGMRSVVLTFDDAWADNHTHALGPLSAHHLPATLYVPSRLLGKPGYMTRSQVLEMAASGVTIGAHSRTHADLPACGPAELEAEVRGSRDDLEEMLGQPVTSFAYPAGRTSDAVVAAVAAAGFACAVTSRPGWWRPATPPLRIPRAFVEDFSEATFVAALCGGLTVLRFLDVLRGHTPARLRQAVIRWA
jgi:peptidoglycan/xylan/chitin deacetylase (PgdA/CDA1 family)